MHFLKASAFVVGLWNQKEGFHSVMIAFVFLSDLFCLLDAVYHTIVCRRFDIPLTSWFFVTFQFYITQEVLIDIVTLFEIRVADEKRSVFVRWLFTPDVCKIIVYRWLEVNSGIPSRTKFDGTVDFPFSVLNLVRAVFK